MKNTHHFLTDAGLETILVFHEGHDLPEFAAFPLLHSDEGIEFLRDYYRSFLELAAQHQTGFVLESPTWRANSDWGRILGFDEYGLRKANELAISELKTLRKEFETRVPEILVSGCIGPRGDGYTPSSVMTEPQAEHYHAAQVATFADSGVDLVCAMTLNYTEEAIGIVRAARAVGVAPVISFTVETDGCLPTGETLQEAIERTDAKTDGGAAYFMINCAHPNHFEEAFEEGGDWIHRIGGLRSNASRMSHEELDNSETLDEGDPSDLADRTRRLRALLPELNVFGGCCGTDIRHIRAMGEALSAEASVH